MRLIAIAVAIALLALALPNPADAKMPSMTISSPHLAHSITVTWPDTVAFWEAAGSPTRLRLVDVPSKLGPKYEVLSWYWQRAVGPVDGVHAADVASYYPYCARYFRLCDHGIVQVSRGEEDVWIELDEERDAILRRYVTLGRVTELPEQPAAIELFAAAAVLGEEDILVSVEGRRLNGEAEHVFWQEIFSTIGESRTYEYRRHIATEERILITLLLPEGRAVTLQYIPWLLCFCPEPSGSGLTPTVRLAGVPATPLLNGLLDKFQNTSPEPSRAAATASPTDSPVEEFPFWVYILVAGWASVSIVAAAVGVRLLQRRRHHAR